MVVKPYVIRVYLCALAVFVVNRFLVRPAVAEHGAPEWLRVFTLSVPNTIEGIMGLLLTAGILGAMQLQARFGLGRLSLVAINLLALLIAGIYVIFQELNIHRLGGPNIYDPNDIAASIIGLAATFVVVSRYGVVEPESVP